jgi:hypothetical protein
MGQDWVQRRATLKWYGEATLSGQYRLGRFQARSLGENSKGTLGSIGQVVSKYTQIHAEDNVWKRYSRHWIYDSQSERCQTHPLQMTCWDEASDVMIDAKIRPLELSNASFP